MDWIEKAKIRNLLSMEDYNIINSELQKLPKSIHHLINYTDTKLKF